MAKRKKKAKAQGDKRATGKAATRRGARNVSSPIKRKRVKQAPWQGQT